jgi:hypothetical protein
MRFQTFIKSCFLVSLLCVLCLSKETPFISINGDCRYPAVVSDGNTLYLAWLAAVGGNAGIYFRRSIDEGRVWSTDQRISNEGSSCYPPAIAENSGVVHAAWVDYGERIEGEVYYNRSLDGGNKWEANRILVDEANSARYPLLVCKADNVFLIWQDIENKTYFKASHDKGQTWDDAKLLAKLGKHSCYCYPPALCVCNNEVSVVWTDVREESGLQLMLKGLPLHSFLGKSGSDMVSTVVRRKSTDAGMTWSNEQILAKTKVAKEAKDEIDNPTMLSDGSMSYIFWLDRSNQKLGEIFYAGLDFRKDKFPVCGKSLLPPERRSPKRPSVVFDAEKRIHLAWTSFLGPNSIVCYSQSDKNGNLLIDKKELTSDTCRYHNPVITSTSSGLLNVFWFDEPKDEWSQIFMKTSRDNGQTWETWGSQKKDM